VDSDEDEDSGSEYVISALDEDDSVYLECK